MERQLPAGRHRLGASLPHGAAILALGVVVLALLTLPLLVLFSQLSGDVGRLRAAVAAAQIAGAEPGAMADILALRALAAEGIVTEAALQQALAYAGERGVAWLAVLERVVPSPDSGLSLTGLWQRGAELQLRVVAVDEAGLSAYLARLRASSFFDDLQIERGAAEPGTVSFTITLHLRGYEP
jgi:Tfp pilus assembly protein PilN